jgi:hypothetical protein
MIPGRVEGKSDYTAGNVATKKGPGIFIKERVL